MGKFEIMDVGDTGCQVCTMLEQAREPLHQGDACMVVGLMRSDEGKVTWYIESDLTPEELDEFVQFIHDEGRQQAEICQAHIEAKTATSH